MKELEAIKERVEAATGGPWNVWFSDENYRGAAVETAWAFDGEESAPITDYCKPADATFIAHARTDIPKLVAALEASLHACTLVDIESNEAQQDWLVSTIRTVITEALA